jgi:hypothetical protein
MQRSKSQLIYALYNAMLSIAGNVDKVTEENYLKLSSLGYTAMYLERSEFDEIEEIYVHLAVGDSISEWVHRHNNARVSDTLVSGAF